jgi:hypothetical protein
LHLPHHHPHVDPELLSLLYAIALVVLLLAAVVGIFWIATYGGARAGAV